MYTVMPYNELERILSKHYQGKLKKLPNTEYQIDFETTEDAEAFAICSEIAIPKNTVTRRFNHDTLINIMRKVIPKIDRYIKRYLANAATYAALAEVYQHPDIFNLQSQFVDLFTDIETTSIKELHLKSSKLNEIIALLEHQNQMNTMLINDKQNLPENHLALIEKIEASNIAFITALNKTRLTYQIDLAKLKALQKKTSQLYEQLNNTLMAERLIATLYGKDCEFSFSGEIYCMKLNNEKLQKQFAMYTNKPLASAIYISQSEINQFQNFLGILKKIDEIKKLFNKLEHLVPKYHHARLQNHLNNMEKEAYSMSKKCSDASLEFLEHLHTLVVDTIQAAKDSNKFNSEIIDTYKYCFSKFDNAIKDVNPSTQLISEGIHFALTLTGIITGTVMGLATNISLFYLGFPGLAPGFFISLSASAGGYAGYNLAKWLTSFSSRERYRQDVINFRADLYKLITKTHDPKKVLQSRAILRCLDNSVRILPDNKRYQLTTNKKSSTDQLVTLFSEPSLEKTYQQYDSIYMFSLSHKELNLLKKEATQQCIAAKVAEAKLTKIIHSIEVLYPQPTTQPQTRLTIKPTLSDSIIINSSANFSIAIYLKDQQIEFSMLDGSIKITNNDFNKIFKDQAQIQIDAENFERLIEDPQLKIKSVSRDQGSIKFTISAHYAHNSLFINTLKTYAITPTIKVNTPLSIIEITLDDFKNLLTQLNTKTTNRTDTANFSIFHSSPYQLA